MSTPILVSIPQYLKYVELSKSRRARFYSRDNPIPARYKDNKFNALGQVVDAIGNPIVANSRAVGTPKLVKINGQALYNGVMSPVIRSKIVLAIKASFVEYVRVLPVLQLPLRVGLQLHDIVGKGNWDLDNLWLYNKCFQDVLVSEGKIPDDNVLYITAAAAPEFHPVDTDEERKLVFVLTPEERPSIITHPEYAHLLSPNSQGATNNRLRPDPPGKPAGRSKSVKPKKPQSPKLLLGGSGTTGKKPARRTRVGSK